MGLSQQGSGNPWACLESELHLKSQSEFGLGLYADDAGGADAKIPTH
jgi:hypothetical protein